MDWRGGGLDRWWIGEVVDWRGDGLERCCFHLSLKVFIFNSFTFWCELLVGPRGLFNGTGSQEVVYSAVAVQFCLQLREKLLTKMVDCLS